MPNPATLGLVMHVTRPDGQTPCYSIELGANFVGGNRGVVFRNGAGAEIARGVADASGRITIACDRATELLEDTCVPPARPVLCAPGVCR